MKHLKKTAAVVLAVLLVVCALTVYVPAAAADDDQLSTNHCEDWANYSLRGTSNYASYTPTYTGFGTGTETLRFRAPKDIEIISFSFRLIRDNPAVTLKSCTPCSDFIDCTVNTENSDMTLVTGRLRNASPSVFVKEGTPLVTAVVDVDVSKAEFNPSGLNTNVYLDVTELIILTDSGYVTLFSPGEDDPLSTNHCCEGKYDIYSNFFPDQWGVCDIGECTSFSFRAPDDIAILDIRFTLFRSSPYITVYDYFGFTDEMLFDKSYDDDMAALTGSFSSLTPITVKKGEPLITVDICLGSENNELDMEIEDMTVMTADGAKLLFKNGVWVGDGPVDPVNPSDYTEPSVPASTVSEPLIGDLNGNGVRDVGDCTILQRFLAEYKNADGSPIIDVNNSSRFRVADVDRDGAITVADVTMIQRALAEYKW